MSIKVTSWLWEQCEQTGTRLLLMLSLGDNANDEGYCFPAISTIAKRCRADARRAIRILQEMEARGEIRIVKGAGPNSRHGHTNRYYLLKYRRAAGIHEPGIDDPPAEPVVPEPVVPEPVVPAPPVVPVPPLPVVPVPPRTINRTVIKNKPPSPLKGDVLDEAFHNLFWPVYPVKDSKQAALKAWQKLKPDAKLQEIIVKSVKRRIERVEEARQHNQFCPHWPYASTWLNNRRWEDESANPGGQVVSFAGRTAI